MLQSRQVTSCVKKICSPNLSRSLSSSDVMIPTLTSRISICFLRSWHLQNEVVECVCFGLDNYQELLLCFLKLRTVSWQRQACLQTSSCVSSICFQGYNLWSLFYGNSAALASPMPHLQLQFCLKLPKRSDPYPNHWCLKVRLDIFPT